jgi:hypothetical protein
MYCVYAFNTGGRTQYAKPLVYFPSREQALFEGWNTYKNATVLMVGYGYKGSFDMRQHRKGE